MATTGINDKKFDDQIEKLINGEEITIPTFDFISGEKVFKNKMTLEKNDILLILGKGHENYQIINGISYHFNDKEEVLKCINKCN